MLLQRKNTLLATARQRFLSMCSDEVASSNQDNEDSAIRCRSHRDSSSVTAETKTT